MCKLGLEDWRVKMLKLNKFLLLGLLGLSSGSSIASEIRTDITDVLTVNNMSTQECLVYNLYNESRSESDLANIMVINTVMNRVKSKSFPNTPCEVIKQKWQYSWTFDKRSDEMKDKKSVDRLAKIVDTYLLNKEVFLSLSQGADHYHNVGITPEWSTSKRMVKVGTFDQHRFYRRK